MKYSVEHPPLKMFMTQSAWYRNAEKRKPIGILWLSINKYADNNLKTFCQPDDEAQDKQFWLDKLGKNKSYKDWNHLYHTTGFNCWIGKFQDNMVSALQTSPWNFASWDNFESNTGMSCSDGWIKICICEDNLKNPVYFNEAYKEACEITAYLCEKFNINPNGISICDGLMLPNVTNDFDAKALGIYTSCSNLEDWMFNNGKNMSIVRSDIINLIRNKNIDIDDKHKKAIDEKTENDVEEKSKSVTSDSNNDRHITFNTSTKILIDNKNTYYDVDLIKTIKFIKSINSGFNENIAKETFAIAPEYHLDPVAIIAQSIIETNFFCFSNKTLSDLNNHMMTAKQYQNNFCNLSETSYIDDRPNHCLSFRSVSDGVRAQCSKLYDIASKHQCSDWENILYYWPITPGYNRYLYNNLKLAAENNSTYGQYILRICDKIRSINIDNDEYNYLYELYIQSEDDNEHTDTSIDKQDNNNNMEIVNYHPNIFCKN